jgi:agmatine deiminase
MQVRPSPLACSSRRKLIATIGGLLAATNPVSALAQSPSLFRIPGEFEPTAALWIGYDQGHADFTVALVRLLIDHVPIRLLVSSQAKATAARQLLNDSRIDTQRLRFSVESTAMFFLRDVAVFAQAPAGAGRPAALGVVDFQWNQYGLPGWCANRHRNEPARIAQCSGPARPPEQVLDQRIARLTRASVLRSGITIEGGAIEVNGQGLMIANRALLIQRNPRLSLGEIERQLLRLPGISKVIWLPAGLAEDPHLRSVITRGYVGWGTGGHTDEFVRFIGPSTVVLAWPDAKLAREHPVVALNLLRMQANYEILTQARDHRGQSLRVIKLPMPRPIQRSVVLSENADPAWSDQWTADFFHPRENLKQGDELIQMAVASYLNFVIVNNQLILPDYRSHGTPAGLQDQVMQLLSDALPGYRISLIDAIGLNWVGGGPHCATLKEPRLG